MDGTMNPVSDMASRDSESIVDENQKNPSLPRLGKSASHARTKKSQGRSIVERPSRTEGTWERWLLSTDQAPALLSPDATTPPATDRIVCLPSSTLFAWPLWIAGEGEISDLVRLELSGRHLLKRGMEESMLVLQILQTENRRLVLAVAPDEPFPEEIMPTDWKSATRFELPSRLLAGSLDHDLILWEEWGVTQMSFYRNQTPVCFCSVRPHDIGGLIHRVSLRLLAEGVLEHLPVRILFDGLPEGSALSCIASLTATLPQSRIIRRDSDPTPPLLRQETFDLPPSQAKAQRSRLKQREKLFSLAIAGVIFYLLLLLWGAGDLLIRQTALNRLRNEISKIEQPALAAQLQSSRWRALRPVIDPNTYALDLLASVAAPTQGGKVRLTLFSLEQGRLHLSGETTDVTQAYSAIEQLKKNPLLQEYDWNASQPQLAGKNSVRFDMEGTRPDASHETAGTK